MKKAVCIILAVLFLLLSGCSGKEITIDDQIKAFDKLCLLISNYSKYNKGANEDIEKNLRIIGLNVINEDLDKTEPIGADFIDAYLLQHTTSDLFNGFQMIYDWIVSKYFGDYISGEWYHECPYSDCQCSRCSRFLKLILQKIDCEPMEFNASTKGKSGFYTEHPEAEPQPGVKKVTGQFNNSSNGNSIFTSEKQNTITVDYYGDYAVRIEDGYSYNPGAYEWKNGNFIDIPASWDSYHRADLYYKGEYIEGNVNLSNIQIIEYDGIPYKKIHENLTTDDNGIHSFDRLYPIDQLILR